MSHSKNAYFDFMITSLPLDAVEMIIDHRYKNSSFENFDIVHINRGDCVILNIFSNPDGGDIFDVAKFILEIENEVVSFRTNTISFSYISNSHQDKENGVMIISLDTNEYTDFNCSMISDKVTNGDLKFIHSFRYVRNSVTHHN